MLKRALSGIMFTLLLMSMLDFGFVFHPVQAENLPDGKLSTEVPSTAFEQDSPYDVVDQKISITYNFPEPKIEEKCAFLFGRSSNRYVSVTMDGLRQYTQVGLPVLPFKTIKILLPFTTEFQHVKAIGGGKIAIVGSYLVEYGRQPVPLTAVESADVYKTNLPNETVYSSSKPFPERLYSDVSIQNKMGYKILVLNLYPVEYIPNTGKLYYYESIRVEVEVASQSRGETTGFHGYPQRCEIVESMVDNREVIETYPTPRQTPAFQYVIITNGQLNNTAGPYNFQALIDEKISRNITATMVTTEWIYANYSGTRPDGSADDQTRIRNFILDAYNNWGALYVLLGGDGDGGDVGGESGDVIIPHRGFASEMDDDVPADMYYGCLDGTFDYDCDGVYGEPNDGPDGGEVDLFAEVYVGRACVDSQTEVQNFVRKTLSYQNTTGIDLRKVWMVGEYLGFGGVAEWGGNYKEEIKEGANVHGYTTVGFENTRYSNRFDVFTLYDRDHPVRDWDRTRIVDVINSNVHLINHLGHADVGYVMKMTNPDVDGLTNDQLYFIGYSQGCYCGAFDDRTTSPGLYTNYDCISEHFTTETHGAVAFISNSRYGWGAFESTDGPSQHYDREFWDAVLGEGIFNLGIANQDSKEDNVGRVGDWVERYCYYEINLFGDPELQIKVPPAYQHDLHVTLDAPNHLEPDSSSLLNGTVRNRGLNNETNVELSILINGAEVANTMIPKLVNGTSHTINHTWTPTVEAVYNVTAYAQPVPDENATWNNKYTEFVSVHYLLINPEPGQYANYVMNYYAGSGDNTEYWNLTYDHYVETHKINIRFWYQDPYGYNYTDWMIVDTMTRYVESGAWAGMWYPGWIETDIDIGATINLLFGIATVNGSRTFIVGPRVIDCWEISYSEYGYPYTFWYDKTSGLWIGMETIDPYSGELIELSLTDTNVPIGITYEHDLGVTLNAPQHLQPDEISVLNATVYNLGLNNETEVETQLLINCTQVANRTLAKLVNGTWRTINYSWTPVTEGIYNITAYAAPVPGENVTINNIATQIVYVRYTEVALISDPSELLVITPILDSIGIGYDIYNDNYYNLYTEDLDLLLNYTAVIFFNNDRTITSTEHSTLDSYLAAGGNLLVTGYDSLATPTDLLLADIVRSYPASSDIHQSDLYVVDDTHPIMDGPYGSFPAGYHIPGLYDICDDAEADTTRGAVTVAELADGHDKIIATQTIGGKVVYWNGRGDYDWIWNSNCTTMFKNIVDWMISIRVSINPSAGSPETKVTVTGTKATANGTVSIYWDDILMENITANAVGDFTYLMTVPSEATVGVHEIMAMDIATGRTGSTPFRIILIALNPTEDPIGTNVTVNGAGFAPESQVTVTFSDMLIGYTIIDSFGNFTFTFNIPLSTAGKYYIKALDAEGNYACATFTVIDVTPLDVQIDVGTMHFKGEIAEFYAQTTFKGQAVSAIISSAILYKPDGTVENLLTQDVAIGLYKIPYAVPGDAEPGTYTLVITAHYVTDKIQAVGTSFKCFVISSTLTNMNMTIQELQGDIATIVVPNLGTIKVDLTAINATLVKVEGSLAVVNSTLGLIQKDLASLNAVLIGLNETTADIQTDIDTIQVTLNDIQLKVIAINETTATIQTTLGIMNGTIISIEGNTATIETDIGTVKADISSLKETQETWIIPQCIIIIIVLIAAASSTLSVIFLRRRKITKTE